MGLLCTFSYTTFICILSVEIGVHPDSDDFQERQTRMKRKSVRRKISFLPTNVLVSRINGSLRIKIGIRELRNHLICLVVSVSD